MDTFELLSLELLSFFIKSIVIVFSIVFVIKSLFDENRSESKTGLKITHLNDKLKKQEINLSQMLMTPEARVFAEKQRVKREKSEAKKKKKIAKKAFKSEQKTDDISKVAEPTTDQVKTVDSESESHRKRLFILNFKGDIQASAVESLRKEITAIIQIAHKDDAVLLKLNNAGGYVHTHGLAASQLTRLNKAKIHLTIAIDQVAASGGYMMACVGQRIIAAPFAIIGSIGVVAQVPNIHRLLKKHEIDVELHTAGQFKRTLTLLGENTEAGRTKFIEDLHKTHNLFQDFVQTQRSELDVEKVATGETWYGSTAVEVGLVDEIQTSDEYILESLNQYEIFSVEHQRKRKMSERALSLAHNLLGGRLPSV